MVKIQLTGLTSPHFCSFPKPVPGLGNAIWERCYISNSQPNLKYIIMPKHKQKVAIKNTTATINEARLTIRSLIRNKDGDHIHVILTIRRTNPTAKS